MLFASYNALLTGLFDLKNQSPDSGRFLFTALCFSVGLKAYCPGAKGFPGTCWAQWGTWLNHMKSWVQNVVAVHNGHPLHITLNAKEFLVWCPFSFLSGLCISVCHTLVGREHPQGNLCSRKQVTPLSISGCSSPCKFIRGVQEDNEPKASQIFIASHL